MCCISTVLLYDGRDNEAVFEMMNVEGAFTRLQELVLQEKEQANPGLHRTLLELIYEMCRIQRIRVEDLCEQRC